MGVIRRGLSRVECNIFPVIRSCDVGRLSYSVKVEASGIFPMSCRLGARRGARAIYVCVIIIHGGKLRLVCDGHVLFIYSERLLNMLAESFSFSGALCHLLPSSIPFGRTF